MDGWDERWNLEDELPEFDGEHFVGSFDDGDWECVLTFHSEFRIDWSNQMAWGRMGVVMRRQRYVLFYRRLGAEEWEEEEGLSAYPPNREYPYIRWCEWMEDSRRVFEMRGEHRLQWVGELDFPRFIDINWNRR